ncbi:MAG: AMP-binding protein, partial [Acidobacteria bacterium]|nr:AMP-binding protein [Acidobacteriota bacterium]
DSLAAIEIRNRIERAVDLSIPLAELLQGPSIRDLSELILDGLASGVTGIRGPQAAAEPVDESPLSEGQKALWFLYRLAPQSTAYVIGGAARLLRDLSRAELEEAGAQLARRHPILQSTFGEVDGEPRQRVRRDLVPPVREVVQEDLPEEGGAEALRALLQKETFQPFDLEREAPFRLALLRHRDLSYLIVSVHHVVADFWSLETLLKELGHLLQPAAERAPLPALPLEYSDYVRWQRDWLASAEGRRQGQFWQELLARRPEALELPTDRPRPAVQSFRGGGIRLRPRPSLAAALQELARERGATLFMTLLAAFKVLLSRYSGQRDLLVGTPTAGRPAADLAGLVGYFVNPVVLRSRWGGDPTFAELLTAVRESVIDAFSNQEYPFPRLVERLEPRRDLSRSPLFQVMFTLQKARPGSPGGLARLALGEDGVALHLGGLSAESVALGRTASQFDLSLSVSQVEEHLAGFLQYDAELFDATTARRLVVQLETLLAAVAEDPQRPLSQLPLLTGPQAHQLLREWNDEPLAYDGEGFIHQLIGLQAALQPEAPAVVQEGVTVSYGELVRRAAAGAKELSRRGVGPEDVVGLWGEPSPDLLVAMLAILGAGAAYLPLDPAYPPERLRFMLEDSGAPLVVVPAAPLEPPGDLGRPLVSMADWETAGGEGEGLELPALSPDHPAYVIFTSGSTGRPKG